MRAEGVAERSVEIAQEHAVPAFHVYALGLGASAVAALRVCARVGRVYAGSVVAGRCGVGVRWFLGAVV